VPQLVKGGKYIFGWSLVNKDGRISIPLEARIEYNFNSCNKIYILNGSQTSKGFSITSRERIKNSILVNRIKAISGLMDFKKLNRGFIKIKNRIYSWSEIDQNGYFRIKLEILGMYSVRAGDKLLVGRGSGFALAFIKEGRIIDEALKHSELKLFK
jgi:hypothetical protein